MEILDKIVTGFCLLLTRQIKLLLPNFVVATLSQPEVPRNCSCWFSSALVVIRKQVESKNAKKEVFLKMH